MLTEQRRSYSWPFRAINIPVSSLTRSSVYTKNISTLGILRFLRIRCNYDDSVTLQHFKIYSQDILIRSWTLEFRSSKLNINITHFLHTQRSDRKLASAQTCLNIYVATAAIKSSVGIIQLIHIKFYINLYL